ncbi:hypothetical protein K503DRAFT_704282, partial [Rhizopogon vinicolor AM-OR11-026]
MGDFNRHHPLWEEIRNRHLYNYTTAQPLIDLIADYGMLQLLPLGLPTLQSLSTDNWTRPDNVFGMEQLLNAVLTCTTAPELKGPKTDHIPILLTLALETPQTNKEPKRNWRETDWENRITQVILDITDQCVPHTKPCPHARRWWTKQLTDLRHKVNRLSRQAYLMRGLPLHSCHDELKAARSLYADEITSTKKQHWIDWLED